MIFHLICIGSFYDLIMDNIINFPTSIIEKERELSRLEIDLLIRSELVDAKEQAAKERNRIQLIRNATFFCLGAGCAFVALLTYLF
tara:strand:- start:2320 stop:2577 length:258 start_codon:yes stop_codon:yes gene_type:complete